MIQRIIQYTAIIFIVNLFYGCSSNENQNQSNNSENMNNKKFHAFVGTYTAFATNGLEKSKGIYSIYTSPEDGSITLDTLSYAVDNPNFLALSADEKYLYASGDNDTAETIKGVIHAFEVLEDNTLRYINTQSSLGNSACHVALDKNNKFAFVANYSSGVSAVYNIEANGGLSAPIHKFEFEGSGPHKNQKSSHPHQTTISPDNKFAYIPDLGTDRIHAFRILSDENKVVKADIEDITLPPGSGPRHMTFHPNGKFAYVINELNSTLQSFEYDAETGFLKKIALYSTLPEGYEDVSYCADIHIDPSGEFLYGSNRGHNSLVGYKINQNTGELEVIGHYSVEGNWPRNFAISPNGEFVYVANRKTGNITTLKRDLTTGQLSLVDSSYQDINEPVCVLFSK
ncbi:lactonase family protein [Membranihabitans marinus]|uniref:lactonase family protein n=1 Tax=Membranihabitans marinus TaxID=1227546 RepID=UPI001F306514|nr:lactonase family protein [Membranihabitans marinus]